MVKTEADLQLFDTDLVGETDPLAMDRYLFIFLAITDKS
jgi:hypothetical protein